MNALHQWIVGLMSSKALSRRCPNCGKVQVVPKSREWQVVHCKQCGGEIPPKRGDG